MGLFNKKKTKEDKLEAKRNEVLQKVKNGDMSGLEEYSYDKEIVLEAILNSKENITGTIALFLQNGDEDVVVALLDRGWGRDWSYYDEKIQNNPNILEIYLRHGGSLKNATINEDLFLNHKSLALLSFKIPQVSEDLRKRIVEKFNDDFDVALEAVSDSGKYFSLLSATLKSQYGIIIQAVRTYPSIIFEVDKIWMSDARVVKTLLKSLLAKLQVEKAFLLKEALSILLFVGNSAKEPEIYLNYGGDYRKLSLLKVETLNQNMNLALEFVKRGGKDIYEDLDPSLKNNLEIAYQAIQIDRSCIHLVTDKLILVSLLKKDPSLRQIMKPEVFKEVNALLCKENQDDFNKEVLKNESIQKQQAEEIASLKTAILNEQIYNQQSALLKKQESIIAKQAEEIAQLKEMLSNLVHGEEKETQSGKKM